MIQAMNIVYLVGPHRATALKYANDRGWTRNADLRFITPDRHDVRFVTNVNDMNAMGGTAELMKLPDYSSEPESEWERVRWLGGQTASKGQKQRFDEFVESGAGRWIEL